MNNPELPSDIEASPASLETLVACMAEQAEVIQGEGALKGSYERVLSDTEILRVRIRPQGRGYPIIEDWMTHEPMPARVASCMYAIEGPRNIHEPMVAYEGRTEIHIASYIGRLMARKREYTYESPYLPAFRRLSSYEANEVYERLKERQRLQIMGLPKRTEHQELEGTNRVTEGDVSDVLDMLTQVGAVTSRG